MESIIAQLATTLKRSYQRTRNRYRRFKVRRSSVSWAGFLELVELDADCSELFDYRNKLRSAEEWTAEPLNDELRRVGCSGSASNRRDISVSEELVPSVPDACRLAFAQDRGLSPDYGAVWTVAEQDGTRCLMQLSDGNFERVTLCDVVVTGTYAAPDSVEVLSIFEIDTIGVAPDERLPYEKALWAEADRHRSHSLAAAFGLL